MKKPRYNTIEINGKLYDAKSGKPVTQPTAQAKKSMAKSIDGVKRSPAKSAVAKPTPKTPTRPVSQPRPARRAAPKATTSPKRSKTLHRRSVNKPNVQADKKPSAKRTAAQTTRQKTAGIIPKLDSERVKRAKKATRSTTIGRFYTEKPKANKESAAKRPAPSRSATVASTKPISKTPSPRDQSETHNAAKRAIDAHRKSLSKRRRLASYATTATVVLLLAGYVTYLNVPGISMRVAASRAGFAASLPEAPSGYRLNGPIAHSPGQVVVNFKSNTDNRHFSLTQQPTTWDSLALLENYVLKQSGEYTTYQDRGLTIYVYEDSSAAWVNNGKMHIINAQQAQLAINQVLDIAGSM